MKGDFKSYLHVPAGCEEKKKKACVENVLCISGESMGDAFVLHNELSQYYSLI